MTTWADAARQRDRHSGASAHGIALVLAGTVLCSTAGLFVRLLDVWTIQAWRGLFGGLALLALIVREHGPRTLLIFRTLGWLGLAAVPLAATSMVTYVAALKLTTVASVLIVQATLPLIAAVIASLWHGERASPWTLAATILAFCVGRFVAAGEDEQIIGTAEWFDGGATATAAQAELLRMTEARLTIALIRVSFGLDRDGNPLAGRA